MANITNSTGDPFLDLINAGAGAGQKREGIATKAFILNIAVGLGLFAFEISGFFLLKSSAIGRRIYQPKTYLVQERLRVEAIPANPIKWIRRIFTIQDEELKLKCGLDGYFFIRLIRAMIIIFVPLMIIIVTVLLPINYHEGKGSSVYDIGGKLETFNVTGLDTLSWQNVPPTKTHRYWAHLVCAILAISWTVFRMYREKLSFIDVRQRFLTSPEHRLKASARTVLITNIPSEYRSKEALEALYDVFVDNDDRSRLTVWVNKDYGPLRALVARCRSLRHTLEKEELKIIRLVNRKFHKEDQISSVREAEEKTTSVSRASDRDDEGEADIEQHKQCLSTAYDADCHDQAQLWRRYLPHENASHVSLTKGKDGSWEAASRLRFWAGGEKKKVPKIVWLRAEIAHLNIQIEECLLNLDDEGKYKKQNSAFIQFDRQMSAHMACSLVSHNKPGRMSPRYLEVSPHEIIWPNMGITSLGRFLRTCLAFFLFVGMLFIWGLPTAFLGFLSQLGNLRASTSWLHWLQPWPSWVISIISGPLTSILLALLIQLIVPALSRKLAVLLGTPTRSKREVVTQNFYFTFLFIELVLVTSISSGIVNVIPTIIANPVNIPNILATNLPKAANYFFNYLIIQALGFSGSVLFQYLRVLYVTTIWPWFTQTPREEAWLQTTIPHQMWGNVYSLTINFAVIGLIYCIISPLMLVFVSMTFALFWVAYRHNYYYVQRNKVDTHGLLFNNAMSQLFAGIYVLEIALIGLFFLVRDSQSRAVCSPQAIIMIIVLVITAAIHFVIEQHLSPLYEFLPVTLEDTAVDAEVRQGLLYKTMSSQPVDGSGGPDNIELSVLSTERKVEIKAQENNISTTAANARSTLSKLKREISAKVPEIQAHIPKHIDMSRRQDIGDQLAAALASYPDELSDLSLEEREAELKAAFQDPATREPPPIIWLPQDPAGISDDAVKQSKKYGRYLQYSNTGAFLTPRNKCEVTQPAPDVRPDWLLDWVL